MNLTSSLVKCLAIIALIAIEIVECRVVRNTNGSDEASGSVPGEKMTDDKFDFKDYHSLNTMNEYMKQLDDNHSFLEYITLDQTTYEGRNIFGMKLDIPTSFITDKKAIVFESGMHGNERITPMATLYMLHSLVDSREGEDLYWLARGYAWYFFPVVCPDGYEYNFNNIKLREGIDSDCISDQEFDEKNLPAAPNHLTKSPHLTVSDRCVGADPNRNFDYHWKSAEYMKLDMETGECLEFPGEYVWSERCVKAFADYISVIGQNLHAYFSIHQNGPFLIIPYGDSDEHLDNYDEMYKVITIVAHRIKERYQREYCIGNVKETIVKKGDDRVDNLRGIIHREGIRGSSIDWVKRTWNTPIVLQIELPESEKLVRKDAFSIHKSQSTADFIEMTIGEALNVALLALGEYSRMFPESNPKCPPSCTTNCPPWCTVTPKPQDSSELTTKRSQVQCPSGCLPPICPVFCMHPGMMAMPMPMPRAMPQCPPGMNIRYCMMWG